MFKPPKKIRSVPHGEVQKQFIVIGVVAIAVILLLTFLFTQGNLAGQAFNAGGNQLNWEFVDRNTLQLSFNPAGEVNSIFVEFAGDVDLCDHFVGVQPLTEWQGLHETECNNGVLGFMDASIAPTTFRDSRFPVANFLFDNLPDTVVITTLDAAAHETAGGNDVFIGAAAVTETFEQPQPAQQVSRDTGGGGCSADWNCAGWSLCDNTLHETRTCVDTACGNRPRDESQACLVCEENWQCDIWSTCSGGRQTRTCTDLTSCGTTKLQPPLQQACSVGVSRPVVQPPAYQPPVSAPPVQAPQPGFFEENLVAIIVGFSAVILVILVVLYLWLGRAPKKAKYNYGALKSWMKKEKAEGTSDKDIKKILRDQTGWTKKEVTTMFSKLPKQ